MVGPVNASLVLFARIPRIGCVKSRLQSRYAAEETLALYLAMLHDSLALAAGLKPDFDRLSVYWAGDSQIPPPEFPKAHRGLFEHHRQTGEDLGLRMFQATRAEMARGSRKVILIGCDSPDLPREYILAALRMLDTAPLVFGPTEDGGYYLAGSSLPVGDAFLDVDWASSDVLEQTLKRLRERSVAFLLLPPWCDIDRPEDLDRLAASNHPERAPCLRACLAGIDTRRDSPAPRGTGHARRGLLPRAGQSRS